MMARNTNVPFKGRIQKRKTYHLQIITFGLQRAAGPYRSANRRRSPSLDHLVGARKQHGWYCETQRFRRLQIDNEFELG
jgi:hypothetical protein